MKRTRLVLAGIQAEMDGEMTKSVSKVEVTVLGLLAEEPLHGYDLLARFRDRSMGYWAEVGKASVYQTLRRLESRGFVSGRDEAGTEGPDRRVFRITGPGRERLRAGLNERFAEQEPFGAEAGLALGFARLLGPAQTRKALATRERALNDLIVRLGSERVRAASVRSAPMAVDAMLDRQETLARAELGWLATFEAASR